MIQKPFKIPTQRKVQARNGVIQSRLESKKGKPTIFDQKIKKWTIIHIDKPRNFRLFGHCTQLGFRTKTSSKNVPELFN